MPFFLLIISLLVTFPLPNDKLTLYLVANEHRYLVKSLKSRLELVELGLLHFEKSPLYLIGISPFL